MPFVLFTVEVLVLDTIHDDSRPAVNVCWINVRVVWNRKFQKSEGNFFLNDGWLYHCKTWILFCFCLKWWQIGDTKILNGSFWVFHYWNDETSLYSSTDLSWICHWRQMLPGGPWYRRGVGMWMKLLFITRCLLSSCDCHQSLFLSVWFYFMQCDLLEAVF